ncbi:MAG TPA: lysophospholipid acyltransferase family protein [Candidatus Paceibacterota bacterium]|nr:lysophospholipid acyltransferase family protein [Candidatus Pacearchaeota archaeon]HRZ51295.1 lysophospholipid acyltransferase family protein [Candidatus Paceibacterota bacterium]HSA37017.1 lysophospholipid acyltransferase family protein [Candidatus Paceibacterota bacterium]
MNTIVSTISRALLGWYIKGAFIEKIEGLENIPKTGNFILASNHLSHLDWFMCGYIVSPRKFTYIGQVDRYNSGIEGIGRRIMYLWADVIPIDRTNDESKRQALIKGVEMLRKGYCVIIYPEGGRSYEGKMKDFKPGVGMLHLQSGAPVLPVAFNGTYELMPPGGKLKVKKIVKIAIGKPLDFVDLKKRARKTDTSSKEYRSMCVKVALDIEDKVRDLYARVVG